MSFLDAREHGSKPGSGGAASAQNEVPLTAPPLLLCVCSDTRILVYYFVLRNSRCCD